MGQPTTLQRHHHLKIAPATKPALGGEAAAEMGWGDMRGADTAYANAGSWQRFNVAVSGPSAGIGDSDGAGGPEPGGSQSERLGDPDGLAKQDPLLALILESECLHPI